MSQRVAVVTGANKGIGLEIAKKLAAAGMRTIMAARNEALGLAAVEEVGGESAGVEYRNLDISKPESVRAFAAEMERDHGKIDCLVNNAGFAFKGADPTPHSQQARPTFEINYFGTLDVTLTLLPLLRKGDSPRVVNVASFAGSLKILKSQEKLNRVTSDDLTLDELNEMANGFITAVEAGEESAQGWPSTNYGFSKLMLIAATRVLARQEMPDIAFNACCPGYVATDMSSHRGKKTPEEGARTPSMLALMPAGGPTGKFFSDEAEAEW